MFTALLLIGVADGVRADWRIDDNVLAYRLFAQGQHADAAEIFTDPAWKGVALYRSEQWWRAAEAFVRADDPVSAYNLGNCYVKLGYYALALDAYQRALTGQPDLADAHHNAELMRQLLASDDDASERGGRRDPDEEIDRLESDEQQTPPGGGAGGDQDGQGDGGSDDDRGSPEAQATPADASDDADDVAGERALPEETGGQSGESAIGGEASEARNDGQPTGTSETDAAGAAVQASGARARLESEQATEQWLNRIEHDPARYLDKRIRLEIRRRRAAGQSAPAGGSGW